jgi:hypothetical protein
MTGKSLNSFGRRLAPVLLATGAGGGLQSLQKQRQKKGARMFSPRLIFAGLALTSLIAVPAEAAVLYYGGDPSQFMPGYYYAAYNELNPSGDSFLDFDNFTVPTGHTWTVTGLFEQMSLVNPANPPVTVNWQIRTGLTMASMGTLLAGGQSAPQLVPNGIGLNGVFGETLSFDLSSPLVLAGGQTYWLAIQPISRDYHMFVGGSTDHVNAVGGPLNYDTTLFSYIASQDHTWIQSYGVDLSQGVTGTDAAPPPPPSVPEPSGLALLVAGLPMLFIRRRKRRTA